jgi:hypothetical protein
MRPTNIPSRAPPCELSEGFTDHSDENDERRQVFEVLPKRQTHGTSTVRMIFFETVAHVEGRLESLTMPLT